MHTISTSKRTQTTNDIMTRKIMSLFFTALRKDRDIQYITHLRVFFIRCLFDYYQQPPEGGACRHGVGISQLLSNIIIQIVSCGMWNVFVKSSGRQVCGM